MKRFKCLAYALMIACGSGLAEPAIPFLAPGGVSFVVEKAVPESATADTRNLVTDGTFDQAANTPKSEVWGTLTCIHAENPVQEMKEGIDHAVSSQVVAGENPYYHLKTTPAIRKYQTPEGLPMISNRLSQTIPWNGEAARVKMTFRGRGGIAPGSTIQGWQGLFFFAYFWAEQRYVPIAREYHRSIPLSQEFNNIAFEFNIPEGTKNLFLEFSLYHAAEASLDDITLSRVTEQGLEAAVFPFYVYPGEAFHIEQGVPAALDFRIKRNDNAPLKSPELIMELPAEIEILGVSEPARILSRTTGNGIDRVCIDVSKIAARNPPFGRYNRWGGLEVAVQISLPPSDQLLQCRYYLVNDGYKGKEKTLPLKVMQKRVQGKTPQRFVSGASGFDLLFDEVTTDKLVNAFTSFGFNAVKGNFNAESVKASEKYRLDTYGEIWYIMNGYRIGAREKPLEAAFIQEDGTPLVESYGNAGHICPVEVYTRGSYYREYVRNKLMYNYVIERRIWSNMAVNWEPFNSEKGCFCTRCMEDFISYSKLPHDEIAKSWPKEIKVKYYDIWRKFRSWQHGLLVEMLDQDMKELAASINRPGAFIPIVEYSSLTSWWNRDFPACNPVDYLDKIRFIQPFGPYFFYHTGLGGDQYFPGVHSLTFAAAEECMRFVAGKIPDESRRPGLLGYPLSQEFTSNSPWVTEPESLSFDTLCFFVNQWKGSFAYLFPHGYDHRWFQALADAHAQIGENENEVMDGTPEQSFFNVKALSPIPSGDIMGSYRKDAYMFTTLRQPQVKDIQMILSKGFQSGNKYLVALGNPWLKSEMFLSLTLTLPSDKQWSLTVPDKKVSLGHFSSAELARGITVYAGALRWEFYRIEPYTGNPPEDFRTLDQEMIRREFLKRFPQIKKKAEEENNFIRTVASRNQSLSGDQKIPEKFKAVSSFGVSLVPVGDRTRFRIKTSEYEADLWPGKNASIVSLKTGDGELVCQNPMLGLGRDSFILPHIANKMPLLPFSVDAVIPEKNGILIRLSCSITPDMNATFNQLLLQKEIRFSPQSVEMKTVIRNLGDKEVSFAFRYHNLPEHLSLKNGKAGNIIFAENKRTITRMLKNHLHRSDPVPQKEIDQVLDATALPGTVSGKLTLVSTDVNSKLTFIPDRKNLYGVFVWEGNFGEKSDIASLEFIYGKQTLIAGQEWSASLLIELNR